MNAEKQCVVVLGSTGSIGVNTLDVIERHLDRFEVFALTASTSVDVMAAQCAKFKPTYAVMASDAHGKQLASACKNLGLRTQVSTLR